MRTVTDGQEGEIVTLTVLPYNTPGMGMMMDEKKSAAEADSDGDADGEYEIDTTWNMVVPSQRRETKDTSPQQESTGDDVSAGIREGVTTIVLT
jgi:hypothetical protein